MKEEYKKKNVLAVCINNTYGEDNKDNKNPKDLKNATIKSWRVRKNKIADLQYIVGICRKEIKSVYKVEGSKKAKDLKRIDFEVNEVDKKTEKEIKGRYNYKVRFYGPIKYLDF